ncbi:hypothetical protein HHX47_DHR8000471 [Lentinula edodes]|nr:hypothetical protein HHX47_DHR8000471 [Lentinula edodes]
MTFVCSACQRSFKQVGHLIQHEDKTGNHACKEAGRARVEILWRNNGNDEGKEGNGLIKIFRDNFFGNDYTADDFPGLDDDEEDVAGDVNREDENEDEDVFDDTLMDLEQTWEERERVVILEEREEYNTMDIDESARKSSLRSLPAHRDDIHVDVYGGQTGAPLPDSNPTHTFHNSSHGFLHCQSQISGINHNPWAPFQSRTDWEVARWAKMRGPSSTAFSELLEIDGVHF